MVKSAFQNHFANIPQINRPRSQFVRPYRTKHTFNEGELIPFYLDDVLPGDTFRVSAQMFARLATPIFPIMDNMYLEVFWFYVPNRLVWDNFVKQHGEQVDPGDSTDYTTPVIDSSTIAANATPMSLWDNFGLPMVRPDDHTDISALPFRMYNMICRDWFRDQDLQNSEPVPRTDGPDDLANYVIRRVGKYKDYFTTARPEPQKGPSVEIPIGGTAPVWGSASSLPSALGNVDTAPIVASYMHRASTNGVLQGSLGMDVTNSGAPSSTTQHLAPRNVTVSGSGNLTVDENVSDTVFLNETLSQAFRPTAEAPFLADLNQAVGPTVNLFREAVTVQQMYELDMRGGTRFIEMIFNHYGVVNPDFRLQRPEFLGYSRSMVNIHPVPQTSGAIDGDATSETPQGNLAAFGTVSSRNGFVKTFTEFGYVFGLCCVRADLTYQEKVDRHWVRQTRMDYYYPIFANLGEQAVLNEELQVDPNAATKNKLVFGYQERWAEYRFKTNQITGLFRSSHPQSLDAWHLAQEFTDVPELDDVFIEEDAPVDRCIAVPSEPHFIMDVNVTTVAARPMPMYSSPGLTRI